MSLIRNIRYYEYGIYEQILKQCSYQPQSNDELKEAVKIWCKNREKGLEQFGHISLWDTSKITDMSSLFECNCHVVVYVHDEYCKHYPRDRFWHLRQIELRHKYRPQAHECHCELDKINIIRSTCYCGKKNFNDNINNWNMSNVINTKFMFRNCIKFNQPLNRWQFSKLNERYKKSIQKKTTKHLSDERYRKRKKFEITRLFYGMFINCYKFDQDNKSLMFNWEIS